MLSKNILTTLVISTAVLAVPNGDRRKNQEFEEDGRIVNGRDAKVGEFPYQVSIQMTFGSDDYYASNRGNHFCGGTLIAENWVMTAAHCVKSNPQPSQLRVAVGATNVDDSNNPVYKVEKIISHLYDDTTKQGDVALLKLVKNANFESTNAGDQYHAAPATLPPADFDASGSHCNVSGWGRLVSHGHDAPKILQVTDVMMLSGDDCEGIFGDKWPFNQEYMLCAGGKDKDACQGDSGGPLVCPAAEGSSQRYITGIVSWGIGCATEGIPGVYTDVAEYRDWVIQTMNEN